MIQARCLSRYVLVSALCLLLLPTLALAKSSSPEPVGRLTATSSGVQWSPSSSHDRISLTVVAPNGAVFQKEFAAGTAPSFRLQDLGGRLTDGPYTYELRAIPNISAEVRKQLADARAAGDDDAMGRVQTAAGINPNAAVQSGNLLVINGAFVSSDAEEPVSMSPSPGSNAALSSPRTIKPMDVVTPDDAIIQGSLCVGLDCVNNESFGFDTIRLKENNTRIKFDDTSTSSGFPANDWQLTANDSASGGSSKFSIEDITGSKVPFTTTAGAPTNSIFVDSSGRVGLRTGTPVLDLHLATSNTPAHRFEQTSAGGFTAQTWDVAGNEANFFVRDVTGGSRLPFRIRPGAPTSSIDINASGNVGIGTASPNSNTKMDLNDSTQVKARLALTGQEMFQASNTATEGVALLLGTNRTNNRQLWIGDTSLLTQNSSNPIVRVWPFFGDVSALATDGSTTKSLSLNASGGNVGINCLTPTAQLVIASGGACSNPSSSINAGSAQFTVASSRTFKENIEPVDVPDILKKIEAVPVVTYDFKNNGPKDRLGLIAEDFHQVFERGSDKYIDGQEVQMALWMAVQKLTAENKALTERLAKLEAAQQKAQN
jgi:hypothetical protein